MNAENIRSELHIISQSSSGAKSLVENMNKSEVS